MIKVEHIQASITANGDRIDTLICEYPRCIHSQLMTHRTFSKNSSSTRAIPLSKAIDQVRNNPAKFIWTEKQAGMQGKVVTDVVALADINMVNNVAREDAIKHATYLVEELGVHKQNAGRYLEPFQNIKIVLTATEWENWDWLRDHKDAQGEIAELARKIKQARENAEPMLIGDGEWHVPFIKRIRTIEGELRYVSPNEGFMSPFEALMISTSVCAQTSYRNADYSLSKAKIMHERLTGSDHIHASPFEHQAKPISQFEDFGDHGVWPKGVTHIDRNYNYWSGNFKGFIQRRQLVKNHDHAKDIK